MRRYIPIHIILPPEVMYKYIRVLCTWRKSATSSKGVRFPIFLVLKLHVSMRTNKKHDPPCYILHLQWIGIPFEEVLICTSIFTRKCPNVSTSPLRQWGFRQCLPFSWTALRDKDCRHHIAVMGVVDMFRHCCLGINHYVQ